ncbi:putative uncharacterized protein DDB_G0283051 isoform X7 [Bactrocera dorsalis]|uniref:Uncharacterized protein n=1 Tax=Bactrocera dorsalis TaxID=27457 RepID=A0ABM3JND7_BACDO|nr:putative uncharacterized protein DDB_G0283051 isoform X7 [Bactrocera dorsalis]
MSLAPKSFCLTIGALFFAAFTSMLTVRANSIGVQTEKPTDRLILEDWGFAYTNMNTNANANANTNTNMNTNTNTNTNININGNTVHKSSDHRQVLISSVVTTT